MRVCLGFARGAEIFAGRSPLMVEDLLWGKHGLLSLKPQVVAGSVLHDIDGALWVIWLQCDGDCFLHGFYKECFVALHFAAPSVSGKISSGDGKSRKR